MPFHADTTKQAEARGQLDRLLTAVAAGDREALGQLYHLTRTAVYALALSYLKNVQDAQDVTQETFVQVWESAPRYVSQGTPMSWLLTVARNLSLSRLRRRGRESGLEDAEWDAIPAGAPAVTAEDRAVLQDAMTALGEQERQIVLLHAVTGLKHREIAKLLELPLPTVLSKYRRALQKLRARMERR